MTTNESQPLSEELLRKFVAGELNKAENEAIMARLVEDEASLAFVDALWQEHPLQTAVHDLPDLEPERAQQMRRQLIQQIHRADLTLNIVRMGTQGFGSVALSLLRPLLNTKGRSGKKRRRRRGND